MNSRHLLGFVASALAVSVAASQRADLVSGVDRSGLDESVRPQDDFNAYVNGTWLRETQIPADQSRWGSFTILVDESEKNQRAIVEELAEKKELKPGTDEQRVGEFYKSYLDTDRANELLVKPLQEPLNRILSAESVQDLLQLQAELRIDGIDSPLALAVFPDLGDSTRYTVYLFQSGLTLPDRDYYFKEGEKFEALREELPRYATKLFELAGVDDAGARGRAVFEIERRLAEHHWTAEETRDVQKLYNPYGRKDLASATDRIAWDRYLESSEIADVDTIVIAQPSYVSALGGLTDDVALADWKSYTIFRLLHDMAPYLSDELVEANFDFSGRLVNGLEEIPPRWQRGVRNVNQLMGEAVGKLYVARHFPPEAKARMEQLVENLIAAFGLAIDELDWMTDETKERAQEKRKKFVYKIGYPDTWRDYSKLEIRSDDLVGNVFRANAFEYRRNVEKLGGPIDRTEWGMTPQTVNAYHDPTKNEIVFPAAILQPPFFDLMADDAVNYGAIGAVIGHEIGHAFDDQGRRFDGDGNLRDWWSEYDAGSFEESASMLVDQYDAFEALPGLNVNGRLTLGENIGDLTGLTIAYRAYLASLEGKEAPVIDGFTGPQRFFIGYAQTWRSKSREESLRQLVLSNPHAPENFRANGPLRNVPEFYEAFGVKEGDGMWLAPEKRVAIW
ncbi:MAG TPA: M13 family metallopeptidase [Vicinamibacteria bacterium]|nr:M13 family metallopeptidase [Vicinamibacteria bacterium]